MAIDPNQLSDPHSPAPVPPPPAMTPVPAPRRGGLKRLALGCGGTIGVLLILVFGAFFFQMWQANNLLAAAQTKRGGGDYEGAVRDLLTLQADYSSFDAAEEAAALLPEVRIEWAGALREQGQFEESLARYDEVSSPAHAEQVATGKLETELAWGGALVGEKQFDAALTHYNLVLDGAPADSDLAERAVAALPDAYVGLAENALAQDDVKGAFEHLSFVFENYAEGPGREKAAASFAQLADPLYALAQEERGTGRYADAESHLLAIADHAAETPLAQQVAAEFPPFYLEWGQALAADGQPTEAAKVLQYLLDTYPASELVPQAESALIDAEVAAVASSGQAGELPAPEVSGSTGSDLSTYDIANDTVCPLVVLMSGPQSQMVRLDPQTSRAVDVTSGAYQLVVRINEDQADSDACRNVSPFTGNSTFEPGMSYSSSFYIETTTQ
jgi:tetratricopeptide (TPR) repeat protein